MAHWHTADLVRTYSAVCLLVALTCLNLPNRAETRGTKQRQVGLTKISQIEIDAFDTDRCGHINGSALRAWHKQQSAFGCASGRQGEHAESRGGESRVVNGEQALEHEFPFLLTVVPITKSLSPLCRHEGCTGILVHRDLVLTAARCLRTKSECPIGRVFFYHDARSVDDRIDAMRWCWPRDDSDGIAAIKLTRPLDYIPGKLGPACLPRLGPDGRLKRHSASTTCALAGQGKSDKDRGFMGPERHRNLQTVAVKRDDTCAHKPGQNSRSSACYTSPSGSGHACSIDMGGPVVCYDRCSGRARDQVQAFAVGLITGWHKCEPDPSGKTTTRVTDLHGARGARLLELLDMIQKRRSAPENFTCHDSIAPPDF